MNISELGEFGLIDLLSRKIVNFKSRHVIRGIGDDTAVLRAGEGRWLLFTTDMLVEDVHFSLAYFTMRQVGIKSVAVNVSDIAAMGGVPTCAVISLAVPLRLTAGDLEDLYEGIAESAGIYGIDIVGGDTVKSPERLIINVALLCEVEFGKAVYRSGAKPGDAVYVTGTLGKSAAGLYACQHPQLPFSEKVLDFVRLAHLEPRARVEAGRLLGNAGVSAMNDISDGLASEVREICLASGCGCVIWAECIPVAPEVREVAESAGVDPLDWALYGGEDFELVFTLPPVRAGEVEKMLAGAGVDCCRVGEITESGKDISIVYPGRGEVSLKAGGYDHFR